jgi:hypothetical protein
MRWGRRCSPGVPRYVATVDTARVVALRRVRARDPCWSCNARSRSRASAVNQEFGAGVIGRWRLRARPSLVGDPNRPRSSLPLSASSSPLWTSSTSSASRTGTTRTIGRATGTEGRHRRAARCRAVGRQPVRAVAREEDLALPLRNRPQGMADRRLGPGHTPRAGRRARAHSGRRRRLSGRPGGRPPGHQLIG